MIREAFGLIYAGEESTNLRELVDNRAIAALPIGGKYRVIDLPLSNMVNSGIRNVGVITSRNYNSLVDHLGSGKYWGLSRKSDGLFVMTPFSSRGNTGIYRGKVEALKSSMDYIKRAKQEYAVLAGTSFIYGGTYDAMMKYHIESGADITALYHKADAASLADERFHEVYFDVAEDGRIKSLEINPALSLLNARSLKSYIIRKDVLVYLVEESVSKGEFKFSEGLLRNSLSRLKVMGFEHDGYVGTMNSVASYFEMNMDLLNVDIRKELFLAQNRIYTKIKDSVPAKYAEAAEVKNSLVANGCVIEGEVENSILFRGVHVGRDAVVKNSIVFSNTDIGGGADLEFTILDKDVNVRQNSRLVGNREFPMVIRKGGLV
jgi:glucose-1-phosphate adenylyltransferase